MSERTVWVIEQGSYSDYRVVGVFTSEENARRIADKINAGRHYDEAEVAEWVLDPGIDALNRGLRRFTTQMTFDGKAERIVEDDDPWGYGDLSSEIHVWHRSSAPAYRGQGKENLLTGDVWAENEKHAVKIMNEARARMIASGEFTRTDEL